MDNSDMAKIDGEKREKLECTIEEYMAILDPYRVAPGGKIVLPWPPKFFGSPGTPYQTKDIFETVRKKCQDILRDHRIRTRANVFRICGAGRRRKDTLVVDIESDLNSRWGDAASEILEVWGKAMLVGNEDWDGDRDVRVELRDSRKMYQDISWVLSLDRNPEACRALEVAKPVVGPVLRGVCGGKWNFISYTMIPTVLIGVRPGTVCEWWMVRRVVMSAVLAELEKHDIVLVVDVKIIVGEFRTGAERAEPRIFSLVPGIPLKTASIGPRLPTGIPTSNLTGSSSKSDQIFAGGTGSIGAWIFFQPQVGDERAMVLNLRGEWVGLLFAGDMTGDEGLVMGVERVVGDIEAKTGGRIHLV